MDGSAFNQLGRAIEAAFWTVAVILLVSIPLACWKLIDLLLWLYRHVSIDWVH